MFLCLVWTIVQSFSACSYLTFLFQCLLVWLADAASFLVFVFCPNTFYSDRISPDLACFWPWSWLPLFYLFIVCSFYKILNGICICLILFTSRILPHWCDTDITTHFHGTDCPAEGLQQRQFYFKILFYFPNLSNSSGWDSCSPRFVAEPTSGQSSWWPWETQV